MVKKKISKMMKFLFFFLLQFNFNANEKENTNYDNVLKPKLSSLAPNHTKNYEDDEVVININNIFSLDRISKNDTVEGGGSSVWF